MWFVLLFVSQAHLQHARPEKRETKNVKGTQRKNLDKPQKKKAICVYPIYRLWQQSAHQTYAFISDLQCILFVHRFIIFNELACLFYLFHCLSRSLLLANSIEGNIDQSAVHNICSHRCYFIIYNGETKSPHKKHNISLSLLPPRALWCAGKKSKERKVIFSINDTHISAFTMRRKKGNSFFSCHSAKIELIINR